MAWPVNDHALKTIPPVPKILLLEKQNLEMSMPFYYSARLNAREARNRPNNIQFSRLRGILILRPILREKEPSFNGVI